MREKDCKESEARARGNNVEVSTVGKKNYYVLICRTSLSLSMCMSVCAIVCVLCIVTLLPVHPSPPFFECQIGGKPMVGIPRMKVTLLLLVCSCFEKEVCNDTKA